VNTTATEIVSGTSAYVRKQLPNVREPLVVADDERLYRKPCLSDRGVDHRIERDHAPQKSP
jgi:hypothetical protein